MGEKSIISDLFNEAVSFADRVYPQDREYHSKVSMAERQKEKLKKNLSTEQIEMLENLLETQNSYDTIYNEEIFRLGVSLGGGQTYCRSFSFR